MYRYKVADNQALSPTANMLTLKIEGSENFDYQPGQYAAISFYNKLRPTTYRCFSIASSPDQAGVLQFGTRTSGRFTKTLSQLKIEDKVNVAGPFGSFVLEPHRNLFLIAGGIGVTPFISMLRYISKLRLKNKATLIYSVKNTSDIPFLDELDKIEKTNKNIRVIYAVSQKGELGGRKVFYGRVNANLLKKLIYPNENNKFYVCGPPSFMKSVPAMLADIGIDQSQIKTESFSQGSKLQFAGKWPKKVYLLAAGFVVLATLVIMVSDFIKQLPKIRASSANNANASSSSRQDSLNNSINNLQNSPSNSSSTSNASAPSNPTTSTSMAP